MGCSGGELTAPRADGEPFKVSLGPDREITPTMVSVRLVSSNNLRLPSEAENSITLQEERNHWQQSLWFLNRISCR